MNGTQSFRSFPWWQKIISICGLMYFFVVWVLPIFMVLFVGILPYVHRIDLVGRLMIFSMANLLFFAISISSSSKQFIKNINIYMNQGSRWEKIKHWLYGLLGLTMFTCSSAILSPNLLGAAVYLIPGDKYEEIVRVESVKYYGNRLKDVHLRLKSSSNGSSLYLVLSKRHFDSPQFNVGDIIKLSGKRNFVGDYVTNFIIVSKS